MSFPCCTQWTQKRFHLINIIFFIHIDNKREKKRNSNVKRIIIFEYNKKKRKFQYQKTTTTNKQKAC